MKTILITGATGFIGGHLICRLQQSWQLIAAVREDSSQLPEQVKSIVIGEITPDTDWGAALVGVDIVVHLAARAHILQDTAADPVYEFMRSNAHSTENLAKQAIRAGVKQFVFISSIGAMGSKSENALTEGVICQPDTPYGCSKLAAEQALISVASGTEMNWTIFRPTLVYGAGNPGNMERLIKLIRTGLPIPFASIQNRRSLVYVGNLVDAIAISLSHAAADRQTFVISDDRVISTPDLVRSIADTLNLNCTLVPFSVELFQLAGKVGDAFQNILHRPLPLNSRTIDSLTSSLSVDSQYLKTTLDWQPPFTFEQGLLKTLVVSGINRPTS
jgi:nucleoside-diphosphate-sugar epimerase